MRRVYFYVMLLVALGTKSLLAAPFPFQQQRTPDYAKAQVMLDEYSRKTNPSVQDGVVIGVINATGLKRTSANVLTVRRLLANTRHHELLLILGRNRYIGLSVSAVMVSFRWHLLKFLQRHVLAQHERQTDQRAVCGFRLRIGTARPAGSTDPTASLYGSRQGIRPVVLGSGRGESRTVIGSSAVTGSRAAGGE